jgi:ketosteroid isomerase-like protein
MNIKSTHIHIALEILKYEIEGNTTAAKKLMSNNYSQTWMYQTKKGEIFPSDESSGTEEDSMDEIYHIKGREYHIYAITESEHVVMIECIEQYPDEKTGQLYRTPEILVIEFDQNNKIFRGRHYLDPQTSYLNLSDEILDKAYKGEKPILILK